MKKNIPPKPNLNDLQRESQSEFHQQEGDTDPFGQNTVSLNTVQNLTLEILSSDQQLKAISIWEQVEQTVEMPPIACSSLWVNTWLKHFGDLVSPRFVVAYEDRQPVGIALLTQGVSQRKGFLAVNTLHLGTAGEPDSDSLCVEYNDLLVLPDYRKAFAVALNELFNNESHWDQLSIDGWELDDFQMFFKSEQKTWEERKVRSFYHNLSQARTENKTAYNQLGYATRKTVRKNLKAYGELKSEWAETADQAEDIFNELVQLHQARWIDAGEPGSYASERFLNFHRDMIHQLLPQKKVGLFRLSDDEGILGCVHVFIDRNRALAYQGGTVPFTKKKSPGLLVDLYCMEECLKRGLDAYDFLGGEMHHKERLSTDFNTLIWAKFQRKRLKFQLTRLARYGKRFLIQE